MATELKPYPAYKDSGVEWLGRVPAHWDVRRLKNIASLVMGQSPSSEDCSTERAGLPFLQGCAEFGQDHPWPVQFCRAPAKVGPAGAILVSVRAPVGRLNVADQRYGIGRGLCAVVPRFQFLDSTFCRYSLDSSTPGLALRSTGSTYDAVSVGDVACLPTVVPPISEQAAIVRFLAHADRRIRRYIRAKEKLITLLEEQKQALIHEAVTGRIDVRTGRPYPEYRDSGVEWLGEVPAHWRVLRLKDVAVIQTGITLGKDYRSIRTVSRPYLRVANVQNGHLKLSQVKSIDVPVGEAGKATLRWGDVLMTEGGDIDKLGRGCVWRNEVQGCLHQNHVFAVRCTRRLLNPEFLVRVMASQHGRMYFECTAKRTTNLASTNSSTLSAFPIPLPAPEEQAAILDVISAQANTLEELIGRAAREVELMREYHTRLIADVAMGKIDVHEVAEGLPEMDPLAAEEDQVDDANCHVGADGSGVEGGSSVPDGEDAERA